MLGLEFYGPVPLFSTGPTDVSIAIVRNKWVDLHGSSADDRGPFSNRTVGNFELDRVSINV